MTDDVVRPNSEDGALSEERGAEKEIVVGMSPKSRRAVLVKAADAPNQKSAADEISPALRTLLLAIRAAARRLANFAVILRRRKLTVSQQKATLIEL